MGDQYRAQQFIEAIPKSAGIITKIAERVGCAWHTAKKYIDQMPTVKAAYDDECERMLDAAESQLVKAIDGGDTQMIRYYLSTKGKRRGYTERTETVSLTSADIDREIEQELAKLAGRRQAGDVVSTEAEDAAGTAANPAV